MSMKKQFGGIGRKRLIGGDLEIHLRFSEYGGNAKEWLRKCALMLPEIERRKIWRKKGFSCIFEYAAKLAGMSKNQVYDALRIVKKVENLPALRRVVEEKGVNAVRPVVTIVNEDNQEFWAEKAMAFSVRELEVYVKGVKSGFGEQNNRSEFCNVTKTQPVKVIVTMNLDPETADQLNKMKANSEDWEEVMKKLLTIRREQLEQKKPEPVKTEARSVPKAIESFVLERDSKTCVVPGCKQHYHVLHHTHGFSRDKTHDPVTIHALCKGHHDLAHRGLIQNEHKRPQYWRILEEPAKYSPRFGLDKLVLQHRLVGVGVG